MLQTNPSLSHLHNGLFTSHISSAHVSKGRVCLPASILPRRDGGLSDYLGTEHFRLERLTRL